MNSPASNYLPRRLSFLARVLIVFFGSLSLTANLYFDSAASSSVAAFSSIALSVYLLVLARKNRGLLIVFGYLLLTVYSSCVVNYFGMAIFTSYQQWVGTEVASISINIVLIFLLCISVVMPLEVEPYPSELLVQSDTLGNGVIVIICALAFLLCGLFGIGPSYTGTDRQYINPIYEYSIAFLLIGLYFSGGNKRNIILLAAISTVRVALDFSIGSRITSVEILSIWYIMIFAARIKLRILIPILLVAFITMLTVGQLRGSSFQISAIFEGVEGFVDSAFTWDGAYAAYHTSESMVAYRDISLQGINFPGFVSYLISLVVGSSAGYIGLQYEMEPYFWNMGGGYLPFFFYYYLGYGGVVVLSIIVAGLLRFLASLGGKDNVSDMSRFVFVWFSATCFRWLSYSASPLVRGLLLVAAVFLVLGILAKNKPILFAKRSPKNVK